MPIPIPRIAMYAPDSKRVLCTPRVERRYMPSVAIAMPAIGKIRYRPVRLMICPARIDEPRMPNISGTSNNPALLADAPLAICRNVGR